MKPVSSASADIADPVPTTKKTDQYEELGTLGKKIKKPRSLPPKRASRMLLDPFRYGHMHLNGAILEGVSASEVNPLPEGRWSFTYDDLRLDDLSSRLDPSLVGGTWTFHPAGESEVASSGDRILETIEVVPGKRKRVADQLNEIAGNSVFSDTVQDVVNKHVAKKSRTKQSGGKGNTAYPEDPHVLRLDDDDIPTLDDDDIWGAEPVTIEKESVSLFDPNPARAGAASTVKHLTKLVPVITASSDEEDPALSDVEFDDDDALFGATSNDVPAPASPLFDKKASRIQAQTTRDVISEEDSADETTRNLSTGVGLTLGGFARAEKEKGLSVLQKLGINLSKEEESHQADALKAVVFDDSDDEGQNISQIATKVDSLAWLHDDEDEDEQDGPIETFRSAARRLSEGGGQVERIPEDGSSASESLSDSQVDGDDVLLPAFEAEHIDSRHALDGALAPVKTAGSGTKSNSTTKASSSSTSESSDDSSDDNDDASRDDGDGQNSSGNGNGGQGNDGNNGRKDADDTNSESDSSSEDEDSSSDDEDDEDEADEKQKPAKQSSKQEKQSLKDMFAAQPEGTQSYSLNW